MSKCWLSRSKWACNATLMCEGMGGGVLAPARQSRSERSEMARSLTQIQQVWLLMSQQRNKSTAQWVIDCTWISLLPVNSFWVMDRAGLCSEPTALYSAGEKVCVFVCMVSIWVNEVCVWSVCVGVLLKLNTVCACVCNMPTVIFFPCFVQTLAASL